MLTLSACAMTHRGRVRETNEDAVLVTERVVAVADGMGGHAAGEVASQMAVERLGELADAHAHAEILQAEDVASAVVDAGRLIRAASVRHVEYAGMGTTLCGVALVDAAGGMQCAVFNVGDSRVYRFCDGVLTQVSVDHSEVQELRDAGKISDVDAAVYPRRNVITRCLGGVTAAAPDVWVLEPAGRERFLVCSDGLSGEVDDAVIADVLGAHPQPQAATAALVERALEAGGHDNVAVVVADVHEADVRGGDDRGASAAATDS